MTRSTSMDHVEVLRHMKETIKAIAPSEVAALDAAIASLSAPQSGDRVLVRRSAIESAIETLENDGDEHGEGRNLRAAIDEADAPQPPAELRRAADELRRADALARKSDKIDRHKVIGRAAGNNLSVILSALDSLSAQQPTAEAQPVGDPGEFGIGIQPNPKARYWQERAEFWKAQAVALGWREKRDAANGETPPSAPVGVEWPLSLLQSGNWREVYVGHRCMRLEVTYEHAAWERLMEQVEAALAQKPAAGTPVGFVKWFNSCGVQDRPPSQLARAAWDAALSSQQPAAVDEVFSLLREYEDEIDKFLTSQPGGSDNDR